MERQMNFTYLDMSVRNRLASWQSLHKLRLHASKKQAERLLA
jgi:hypothetical protein